MRVSPLFVCKVFIMTLGLSLVACKDNKQAEQKKTEGELPPVVSAQVGQLDAQGHIKLTPLFVGGKPVPASCFSQMIWDQENQETMSLAVNQCDQKAFNAVLCEGEKDCTAIQDQNASAGGGCETSADNCYAWQKTFDSINEQGQIVYTSLGIYQEKPVVLVQEQLNSTGNYFFNLMSINIQDNKFSPQDLIAGGDRCNGGIPEASIENGILTYRQYVTPADMISLSNNPEGDSQTQMRLQRISGEGVVAFPSEPNSCAGKAEYQNGNLVGVIMDRAFFTAHLKEWQNDKNPPKTVVCFDQKVLDHTMGKPPINTKKPSEILFSMTEYNTFLDHFDKDCLGSASSEGEAGRE